ncbi:M20/M25/M40 family metallo-hydrolase [Streptomyces lichenis]|uniref:M20/M25/M40 family metallo-hydrolase n=1 Tax=Streptomyces lichenis TaxID=2306967 RepID=A0ABT0IA84_9ACTN|nr:M20/M25/M40 family metallo-hydrolase [Streptomyces lichenis]MCK8678238.1 M20/M25/M40 family metallo-hydrolase [Streptomyces lichenis]
MDADGGVRTAVAALGDGMLEALADWVRVPSVSGDPDRADDVRRSAHWLARFLRASGCREADVWPTGGLPAVYGCAPAGDPGAPTVLVYSHHDVNAVVPGEWRRAAPFSGHRRGGLLYGRGSSDAKGQVVSQLWALRAHLAATGRTAPAVTVKYLVEGEEEIGSPHLGGLLRRYGPRLRADVVVLSDTMAWATDTPAVCTGCRGSVSAALTLRAAHRDIHNGAVSGAAGNPLNELCRLLGSLHDEDGRITVPGLYDGVAEPTEGERARLAALEPRLSDWLDRTGTFAAPGETGRSLLERIWLRPAAEVTSLRGGRPDLPGLGVIPATASAGLVFRLAPGQRADDIARQVQQWAEQGVGPGYRLHLDLPPTRSDPYTTPTGHPAFTALEQAVSGTFGAPAARMRNGGAAPAAQLARETGAPVLFHGTGLLEDRWHAADERADPRALAQGAQTMARWLSLLPQAIA